VAQNTFEKIPAKFKELVGKRGCINNCVTGYLVI
jgi:hypothetical protein